MLKSYGLPTWAELTKDDGDDEEDDDEDDEGDDDSDSSASTGGGNSRYNPDEPRIPAGQSGGGQWTTAGNGVSSDSGSISADDIRSNPSDTITQVSSIEPMAYTTTQSVPAPITTNIGPNGEGTNQVNIFIGGFGDNSGNYNVEHSDSLTGQLPAQGDGTYGSNYYFTHSDEDKIDALINSLPDGTTINVIGHSWGGDTAAKVAIESSRDINTLITVDPVSWNRPSCSDVADNVNTWININPNSTSLLGGTGGDTAAWFGNAWGSGPDAYATIPIETQMHHENFNGMMTKPASNGKTPLQILNSSH